MPRQKDKSEADKHCSLCGRKESQVRLLKPVAKGFVCDECDALRMDVIGDGEARIRGRDRDPSVNDPYRRYQVELETQADLRAQFQTSVAEPKEPMEDHELQQQQGDELANGFMDHPILRDKVQFNGVNENMKLPSMDPEQWEHYLEHQLQLQNQKRLTQENEQTFTPKPPV